jgi:hypothetical protein
MSQNTNQNIQEELKETVLANEEKKNYTSSKFTELEKIVKNYLEKQDTFLTLKHITL